MDHQRLLLDHLDLIDQIVRKTGRRRHLSAAEREDFAGFVRLRLIDDDYAILRKFQGRSSWFTFLAAVIERLSLDFCAQIWGRWRPSARAERLGPEAVLLERLIARDGHSVDEAIGLARHHGVDLPDDALRRICQQLPTRIRPAEVEEDAAASILGNDNSEVLVEEAEREQAVERLNRGLRAAFTEIAASDRVTIALLFDQNLPIARIASLTGSSVPTIHRRLKRSFQHLQRALARDGFSALEVAGLIGHPSIALSPLLRDEVERFFKRGRLSK